MFVTLFTTSQISKVIFVNFQSNHQKRNVAIVKLKLKTTLKNTIHVTILKFLKKLNSKRLYKVLQHLFPPPHNILALPPQIYLAQVKIYIF